MTSPAFRQGIEQRASQEMLLLPRMLQSIEVLQLPVHELEAFLVAAAEENEALSVESSPAITEGVTGAAEASGSEGAGADHATRQAARAASERHDAWLASQPARGAGLAAHLEEQLGLLELSSELEAWVRFVIRCLDENGHLSPSDDELFELAREEGLVGDGSELGRAIAVVQGLEPAGVGGRDTIESLLLQLDPQDEDYALLCRVLEEFLDEVAKNKLPGVARAMGLEIDELQRLLLRLRGLDPVPGAALSEGSPPTIRAEVIVERGPNGFEVRLDSSGLPSVAIDPEVESLARDRAQPAGVRRYLPDKVEKARWVVDALEQRQRTLLRIAQRVFEAQRAFLEHGPGRLAPLRMTDVAQELEMHVSTVSRAVAEKYAETPWGVLPLRHFFQAAAGGSSRAARDDVRELVRGVVESEDPSRPLSDDEIVDLLDRRGWKLARRTVAKYRQELGIPSSYRRRKYA